MMTAESMLSKGPVARIDEAIFYLLKLFTLSVFPIHTLPHMTTK